MVEQPCCRWVRVIARQYRVDAARRRIDQGQRGHIRSQCGGEHSRYQRHGMAGRDQGDLAGQVGGVQVDAGDDARAGGVLSEQGRRAFVVLGPGFAGQRLDPRPPASS